MRCDPSDSFSFPDAAMVKNEDNRNSCSVSEQTAANVGNWATTGGVPPISGEDWRRHSVSMSKFSYGQSNPTFLVTVSANHLNKVFRFVLRARPKGRLLASAHQIDREWQVMRALHSTSVPVPQVFAYCKDAQVFGAEFFAMEYVPGRVFHDFALHNHVPPADCAAYYEEAVRVLAAIAAVSPRAVGLGHLFRGRTPWASRQLRRWKAQVEANALADDRRSAIQGVHSRLDGLHNSLGLADMADEHLVHGDFRLNNVIFHKSEPRILAVIDWELCSVGPAMADFATFITPFHMPPAASEFEQLRAMTLPLPVPECIPSRAELGDLFCKSFRPASGVPTERYSFFVGLALYRMACILHGVDGRAKQGNASSAHAKNVGRMAYLFVEGANQALDDVKAPENGTQPMSKTDFQKLMSKLETFLSNVVAKQEDAFLAHTTSENRWENWRPMEDLKKQAKALGLWNLWIPMSLGGRLANVQYASAAELMGRCFFASEVFNCSAPDTGNLHSFSAKLPCPSAMFLTLFLRLSFVR